MPNAALRRYPIGAEVSPDGVSFRVWAPRRRAVSLVMEGPVQKEIALQAEADGYYSITTNQARAGSRYKFRLDDDEHFYPDPASRYQPEGPHGPSQVVDPSNFEWTDGHWPGVTRTGQVLYELHVGAFAKEGTWNSAAARLDHLADIGITVIEVMPVADFAGDFGWGYDGVNLFAPYRNYGTPDDFRRFVDQAHAHRIGVILDVVYNHFGPDGNFLHAFSGDYVSTQRQTDWGEAINYDARNSGPVREMMIANAAYWIEEYHLDGLRLDATQNIYDTSDDHLLAAMTRAARKAAGKRSVFITAENEEQRVRHIFPVEAGGYGMDAMWNDDFHHSAIVALTGHSEAYYSDYEGTPQEFISAVKWGFLYQGQLSPWQKKNRGTPTFQFSPEQFITYLENHDQVANMAGSLRCNRMASAGSLRTMTAVLLLGPGTPMLFQGQEFGASTPFNYFAHHRDDLAVLVDIGRRKFLSQFPSQATPEGQDAVPSASSRETFEESKLDWTECERNTEVVALHRDLLRLRREDPVLSRPSGKVDGAVLSSTAFVLRFLGEQNGDRLLLVNLGNDLDFTPCAEPLLAPPRDMSWMLAWSSEDPKYGGCGTPDCQTERGWFLPGRSALFMTVCEGETP